MHKLKGLSKVWFDRWNEVKDHRVLEEWFCPYSSRWDNVPSDWPEGPEFQCSYIKGHNGEHKWYDSDKHGDYDLWMPNSKYDYQLEEFN